MTSKDPAVEQLLQTFTSNFDLDSDYLGGIAEALTEALRRQERSKSKLPPRIELRLKVGELPWLVTEMVRLRKAAGLTQLQVAKKIGMSIDVVGRRESGLNKFTPRDVILLCKIYKVTGPLRVQLLQAAEEARRRKKS